MSDYLSNLSARSFNRTEGIPVLRPRVPSLFEPLPTEQGDFPEMHSWSSVRHRRNEETTPSSSRAGEEANGPDQAEERSVTTYEDVPHLPRLRVQTLQQASEKDPRDGRSADTHPPQSGPRTVIIQQTAAESFDGKTSQPPGRDGLQEPATNGTTVPASMEMVRTSGGNEESPSVQGRREEPGTHPPRRRGMHDGAVENVIVKHSVERILDRNPSAPIEAGGHLNPMMSPIGQQPPERAVGPVTFSGTDSAGRKVPARAEPAIHVTIGRVEVRATVSPQKPTGKPGKPVPTMGLEEYLRRRSGGRD